MRAKFVNEQSGNPRIFSKKQIIDFLLTGEYDDVQKMMRRVYEKAHPAEFKKIAASIGFYPIGKYWTQSKTSSYNESLFVDDKDHCDLDDEYEEIDDDYTFDLDQDIYNRNEDYDMY